MIQEFATDNTPWQYSNGVSEGVQTLVRKPWPLEFGLSRSAAKYPMGISVYAGLATSQTSAPSGLPRKLLTEDTLANGRL